MGKTLLLADDSVTIQKVVGISFASEDIAITTVDNGDEAISRAREMRPDVILADVVMPGKSGYEVCEAVKADPNLRHIPVLLLTGTFEAFDEQRAANAGAAGHVAKPFEAQTLVERVKDLLAQAPSAPPVPTPTTPTSGADNAFDFFDDPVPGEQPARTATPPPVPTAERADLELDGPDAAFAFGDDEFGASPDAAASPQSMSTPPPAAHTVAILPDDAAPDETPPSESTGPRVSGPGAPVGRGTPPQEPQGFDDFEFEGMSAKTPAAEGLAESTLLDPGGDAAFDVSSSELGDLVADPSSPHEGPSAAATQLLETPFPGAAAAPGGEAPSPVSAMGQDPVMEMLSSDPVESAPPTPNRGFVEELPTEAPRRAADPMGYGLPEGVPESRTPEAAREMPPSPEPARPEAPSAMPEPARPEAPPAMPEPARPEAPSAMPEPARPEAPPAMPEPARSAMPDLPPAAAPPVRPRPSMPGPATSEPEPFAAEPIPPAPEPIERPLPDPPLAEPLSGPAPTSDDALAQIGPALQEQLHETLEKIAWEAFGQVTEKVVEQAVERLEKITWEVVPKLAETLIQEEIRKLKAE